MYLYISTARFYMNVVGYKDVSLFATCALVRSFYMNVVGYKWRWKDGESVANGGFYMNVVGYKEWRKRHMR